MAAVSTVGRRNARVLAAIAVMALACTEPQGTEPDSFELASAKPSSGDPTVAGADPAAAPQDTTLDVLVFGSNYDQGSRVDFARGGVVDPKLKVNSTTFRSSRELVANVTVAPDAATVSYDIVVTKSTGKKGIGTERFAVLVPAEMLSTTDGSRAGPVSANGLVVGFIKSSCAFGASPVLWDTAGQLTALPALPGTCGGMAGDINSAGVAVGSAYTGSSLSHEVLWVPSGGSYQAVPLPPLPDGSRAGASGINETGWVVGTNTASVWSQATGWQILPRPSGATTCLGQITINNLGAIVSGCTIAGQRQAVYWPSPGGAAVVLPLPAGGSAPTAWDINDAGAIVGSVLIGSRKAVRRAIRWVPSGETWVAETLPDLGYGGYAHAVNDAGQVAGAVYGTNGWDRPVLWEASGTLRQLEFEGGNAYARGLSDAAAGPIVAGSMNRTGWRAARWLP